MSGANLHLQVVLQALDKASAPFRRVMQGSKTLSDSLQQQQSALRRLNATHRDVGAFRQQQRALTETARTYQAAQERLKALAARMGATGNPARALRREFKQAKLAAGQLKSQHQQQQVALQGLRGQLNAAGVSTRQLSAHERRLRGEIGKANGLIGQQRAQLTKLDAATQRSQQYHSRGMKVATHGAGLALSAFGALRAQMFPIAQAMSFESAMADVKKVVDFESPDQFQKMGQDIEDLSRQLPIVPNDIAKIVAAAGQASIPREELLRFAESAAKMGVAFDTSAEDAGQTMATWRTAFRMSQDDVTVLADKINHLGNTGPASVQKISEVVNRIGALGEVAGLGSGSLAALGATVAGMGIESEVSATGIKNMLLTLSAGDAATARQGAAFEKLGLGATEVAKAMQDDAGGAILGVLDKLKMLPAHEQAAAMTTLFGRESIGAIAPLLTNLDLLKENFGKVSDAQAYGGSMEAEYAARAATSENVMQLLKNSALVLAQTLGKALLPLFTVLAKGASSLAGWLTTLLRKYPRLTSAVAAFGVGSAAAVTAIAGLVTAGSFAVVILSQMYKAVAVLGGGGGLGGMAAKVGGLATRAFSPLLNVGRMLLPILGGVSAPILAIGIAVGIVAALVWKYWEPIKAFMAGVWDGVVEAVGPAMDQLKGALAPLAPLWDMVSGAMGKAWGWVKQLFAPFEASSEQLEGATEAGKGFGNVIGTVLSTGINLAVGAIGLLTKAFEIILPIVMNAIGGVWTYLQGAWDLIVGLFTLDGARITEGVTKIWDGLNQILGGWPAKLMQTGIDMINDLINGALSLESVVQEKIMGIASSIMGTFKSALGIASPSKVFAQFGEFTMQGLAGGLESSQGAPVQQIAGVGDRMKQAGAGVALGIAAMPAMAAGGPVMAPGASAAAIGGAAANYTINIEAPAGADAEGIARLVRQEIEAIERQKASRFASRLTD